MDGRSPRSRDMPAGCCVVALSEDGRLVASGASTERVRLWELIGRRERSATRHAHRACRRGDRRGAQCGRAARASGGDDGLVRLWDTSSGVLQHALRADRRYQGVDITGLTGVTEAQRQALFVLGAVERNGPSPSDRTV